MSSDNNQVISIFSKDGKTKPETTKSNVLFETIVSQNLANQERLRQDRIKANEKVLKSYRLKKNK